MTKFYITMTTFPKRINEAKKSISSCLNQSIKDYKFLLYLNEWEFDGKTPKEFEEFLNDDKFEIRWIKYEDFNGDIKPMKRSVPFLKEFIDKDVLFYASDDDMVYEYNYFEIMYEVYNKVIKHRSNQYITSFLCPGLAGSFNLYSTQLFNTNNYKKFINEINAESAKDIHYNIDDLLYAYFRAKNVYCYSINLLAKGLVKPLVQADDEVNSTMFNELHGNDDCRITKLNGVNIANYSESYLKKLQNTLDLPFNITFNNEYQHLYLEGLTLR